MPRREMIWERCDPASLHGGKYNWRKSFRLPSTLFYTGEKNSIPGFHLTIPDKRRPAYPSILDYIFKIHDQTQPQPYFAQPLLPADSRLDRGPSLCPVDVSASWRFDLPSARRRSFPHSYGKVPTFSQIEKSSHGADLRSGFCLGRFERSQYPPDLACDACPFRLAFGSNSFPFSSRLNRRKSFTTRARCGT